MTYPTPNITDVTQLATYANTVTNNGFWNGIIVAIWFVLFFSLKSYRTETAVISASFVCTILSLILSFLGLVNGIWPIVFAVATGAAAMLME